MNNKVIIVGILVVFSELCSAYWGSNGHHRHGSGYSHDAYHSTTDKYIHPPWWRERPNGRNGDYGNRGPFSRRDHDNTTPSIPPPPTLPTSTSSPVTAPPVTAPPVTASPVTAFTPSPRTQKDVDFRECLANCPVTGEYNPVCGTDNITYQNIGRFECAVGCGAEISIVKPGMCSVNITRKFDGEDVLTCVQRCSVLREFSPVCGTNLVTYANNQRLDCARRCGVDVKLDRMTSCQAPVDVTNKITKVEVDICMELCPVKTILDPVCGSNNTPYINRAHLECAQKCGYNVRFIKTGLCIEPTVNEKKCPEVTTGIPPISSSTVPPKVNPTPSTVDFQACLQTCSITMEYNPICATNGITYTNPSQFACNQFCGVDIKVKKFAACSSNAHSNVHECAPFNPNFVPTGKDFQHCMNSCAVSAKYAPVCGSNGITYKNNGQLTCAQRCGIDVTMVHNTVCPHINPTSDREKNITPTQQPGIGTKQPERVTQEPERVTQEPEKVTKVPEVTTSPYGNIDPNILNHIFNGTTKPTTVDIDSDSDDDIDPRFSFRDD